MKKNQLNKEEEILRDKLNEVKFDFQPSDWTAFEKQLPSSGGSSGWFSGKAIVGAAVVASLAVAWFVSQDDQPLNVPQEETKKELVEEPKEELESSHSAAAKTESEPIEKENQVNSQASTVLSTASSEQETPIEVESSPTNNSRISTDNQTPEEIATEDQDSKKLEEMALMNAESQNEVAVEDDPITEDEEPMITGLSAPDRVCEGGKYTLKLEMENELPEAYTIDWYVAGNLLSKNSRITGMKVEDNGVNQFKIVVKDPTGKVFQSYSKAIETIALPELDFTYADMTDPYQDFSAEVKIDPELYASYRWYDENDKLLAEGESARLDFDKKGIYDIKLQAKSHEGCYTTLEKPLNIVADFDPMAPNALTPLNQDGLNDTFMPEAFKSRNDQFKMQIMTLDGRLVFETNSVLEEWNGKQNNTGQMMPAGQYVWKVHISNQEGKNRTFFGNVRITP